MTTMEQYMIRVRGGQYLPVAPRVAWFRSEHPDWTIETQPLHLDTERGVAVFQAVVKDAGGRTIATATKMERQADFPDFVEKAETGAVGRALALCGYGTLSALDLAERIPVDAPTMTEPPNANETPQPAPVFDGLPQELNFENEQQARDYMREHAKERAEALGITSDEARRIYNSLKQRFGVVEAVQSFFYCDIDTLRAHANRATTPNPQPVRPRKR